MARHSILSFHNDIVFKYNRSRSCKVIFFFFCLEAILSFFLHMMRGKRKYVYLVSSERGWFIHRIKLFMKYSGVFFATFLWFTKIHYNGLSDNNYFSTRLFDDFPHIIILRLVTIFRTCLLIIGWLCSYSEPLGHDITYDLRNRSFPRLLVRVLIWITG